METPKYALENSEKAINKLADLLSENILLAKKIFTDKVEYSEKAEI